MDPGWIIEAFGGPAAMAKALGCHHTRPTRWKDEGIPPRRWAAIVAAARERGLEGITFETLAALRPVAATEAA